jgi:hypothetical protein
MAAAPAITDFAAFADAHPALLDKRLLARHYSSRALASPAARTGWLEPDLAAFPWHAAQQSPPPGPRQGPWHDPRQGPHPAS